MEEWKPTRIKPKAEKMVMPLTKPRNKGEEYTGEANQ